jgi:hypothetical protein
LNACHRFDFKVMTGAWCLTQDQTSPKFVPLHLTGGVDIDIDVCMLEWCIALRIGIDLFSQSLSTVNCQVKRNPRFGRFVFVYALFWSLKWYPASQFPSLI